MKRLAAVAFALLFAASCGRTLYWHWAQPCVFSSDCPAGLHCVNQTCQPLSDGDAGRLGFKRFGEPCDAGAECQSTRCVGGPQRAFCTEPCGVDAGCPLAYECKVAPTVAGPTTPVCTVPTNLLCQTCTNDFDCGASGADKCVENDGGDRFCGRDCTFAGCPPLYRCERQQCVPEKKTCDCLPETLGMMKGCLDRNAFGACHGSQICQLDGGFTHCNAPPAQPESCNGADDDCNGVIDDGAWPTCTKSASGRTCTGPQVCFASAGLVCNAKTPIDEVCNGADDDCNGRADEPFTDSTGRYLLTTHCGGCNRDCKQLIPHSLDVSCATLPDAGACRVSRCESGFYPNDGGTWCLELPDTLCRPCAADSDCVGPGARCLTVDGERVCGRDCGPTSLYPPGCPSGYTCSAGQCQPSTGSCNCKAGVAASRSCAVQTCRGFQQCTGGANPMWSACDVSTFNPEICDGIDNNCNGGVDEGWRNAATGKYDQPANCGFCNNDCTKYFSPTLQHTTGVCNAGPATPSCEMGPCLTEAVGGTTFEWVNVDGQPSNGCECRRVQGNTTIDLPDRAPPWVDENCDGVDGVIANAVFVSASAAAGGTGTRTQPFQTITQGLAALGGARRWVLVAQGTYRENLRPAEGAQLFGGYSSDFLKRDPKVHATVVVGQGTGRATLELVNVGNAAVETVVAGFTIFGWDVSSVAADSADGPASIAVLLQDSGPRAVLATNDIFGGRGGEGGRGRTGAQGFGRQSSGTLNGSPGVDSRRINGSMCSSGFNAAGGVAGVNATCAGSNGGTGGSVVCPSYVMATFTGAQQQHVMPTNGNGAGGFDWSFDSMSGGGCMHVTESGFPTNIQTHDGQDGRPGADGTSGSGGATAMTASRHGTVVGGAWVASSLRPAAGAGGLAGRGGGGGGAGGGVARFTFGCNAFEMGATGGGGGAGACGGSGGEAGGAGGASIAVLVSFSMPRAAASLPTLTGNRIERGLGGLGGSGGFGGAGGLGGAGGFGGTAAEWSSSIGGKGGEGGNGGSGGGGAGGTGGPSFGVLAANVDAASWQTTNTFLTPMTANPGGLGGAGGSSPGAGTGAAGVRGATADLVSLTACGGGCGPGTSCDTGFCVPN